MRKRIASISRNAGLTVALAAVSLGGLITLVLAVPATASWSTGGTGEGGARAVAVAAPAAPTTLVTGRSVMLTWTSLPVGAGSADSYLVRRYDATGTIAQTVGTACSGPRTGTSCTETNVPSGDWRYSISAGKGSWTGPESAQTPAQVQ
jgi:hypothetical protein